MKQVRLLLLHFDLELADLVLLLFHLFTKLLERVRFRIIIVVGVFDAQRSLGLLFLAPVAPEIRKFDAHVDRAAFD